MREFLADVIRFGRWKIAVVLALLLAQGLFEGVGLVMLVPMLELVWQGDRQSVLFEALTTAFAFLNVPVNLFTIAALFVFLILVREMLAMLYAVFSARLTNGYQAHVRSRLYAALCRAQWRFLSSKRASAFSHLLTSQSSAVGVSATHLASLCSAVLAIIVALVIGFSLSPPFAFTVLGIAAVLAAVMLPFNNRAQRYARGYYSAMGGIFNLISDHFVGIKTIKSLRREGAYLENFKAVARRYSDLLTKESTNFAIARLTHNVAAALILVIVILVARDSLAAFPAQSVVLIAVFARAMPRLRQAFDCVREIVILAPAFSALTACEAEASAASDPGYGIDAKPLGLNTVLSVQNLYFRYRNSEAKNAEDQWVLRDLSLDIQRGQIVGIVGTSGAGKSTFADMLIGLLLPERGKILVDGVLINEENLAQWRASVAYVPQENHLLHDSLRANLKLADPNACDEDLWDALAQVGATQFVRKLPQTLDTIIGDRGLTLSGGERQRIALARAVLSKPDLIVLDEATNALNPSDEASIMRTVRQLKAHQAVVLIAHRMSSVKWADWIFVLDQGRVVEQGAWNSLCARLDGRFRQMLIDDGQSLSSAELTEAQSARA